MLSESKKVLETDITDNSISAIWDELSELRFSQIESRKDLSYWHVLVPIIMKLSSFSPNDVVLDVGCGTGHLTNVIASEVSEIIGLDLSRKMVQLAKNHQQYENVVIENCALSAFAEKVTNISRFSAVVANMSLMDMPDLDGALKLVYQLLAPNGRFIFTITHPCFWPSYKGFWEMEDFNYQDEQVISQPFTITGDRTLLHKSILFHRSLEVYFSSLREAGFTVETLEEPYPPEKVLHEIKSDWKYPHFLAFSCRKL